MENTSLSKQEYNDIPVFYCKRCLSLLISHPLISKIKKPEEVDDFDFCCECSSSDIGQCSIEEWEEMYKKAHNGVSFLENRY